MNNRSDRVFIYWDNSNIFIGAQPLASEREQGPDASRRVRIDFTNMLRLAHADRPVIKAVAAGSVPPELEKVWAQLTSRGVEVRLFDRGGPGRGEQEVPDRELQVQMLEDCVDNNGNPGIAVLLTGDGSRYYSGTGFHRTVERLHKQGWRIEILSWGSICNPRMRQWAEDNGAFISLDDYYEAVTFMQPSPGELLAKARPAGELDMSNRPMAP